MADKYCVAIKIDSVMISHADATKSQTNTLWQTVAFDTQLKAVRNDDLRILKNQDGLPIPVTSSVFRVESKVVSRLDRSVVDRFDTESNDVSNNNLTVNALRIDPWELPFTDVGQFRANKSVMDTRRKYRELINSNNLSKFHEDSFLVTAEFLVDKKHNVYKRIVFDKKCHNLPIECRIFLKTKTAKDLLLSDCQTTWVTEKGGLFLPAKVSFSSVAGNPEKPSITNHFETELFWVLGESLSKNLFEYEDGNGFIPATELKEAILENQLKSIPLKSALRR